MLFFDTRERILSSTYYEASTRLAAERLATGYDAMQAVALLSSSRSTLKVTGGRTGGEAHARWNGRSPSCEQQLRSCASVSQQIIVTLGCHVATFTSVSWARVDVQSGHQAGPSQAYPWRKAWPVAPALAHQYRARRPHPSRRRSLA